MKRLLILFSCLTGTLVAKDPYPVNKSIDVLHYTFRLSLSDSTDLIKGFAQLTIRFKDKVKEFEIDLVKKKATGKGMTVLKVESAHVVETFRHLVNDRIKIILKSEAVAGSIVTFDIAYEGIPEDGLIISSNKFGDRVFFGDNWPDRGHHWLPCVDHPSDKATVEYIIIAPQPYQVIATGVQMEESNMEGGKKLSHWKESTPVPVKVMTIGVGRFATQISRIVNAIPVSTWVYPQNRADGFKDFAVAPEILEFFDRFIGPYSYDKLAHVQSKTRWGGLENAGNIFYFENVVNGKNEHEGLIAHETAHQWFGNSVTENDWHHVWLSEGFATYLKNVYFEHKYGETRRQVDMQKDRDDIARNKLTQTSPIVDTTIMNISHVLSINTYQKASWVLHMLRKQLGDEIFWKGVRSYYLKFQNQNALTSDFQREMEQTSGLKLDSFFKSWLYQAGNPVITGRWDYDSKSKLLYMTITQTQKKTYEGKLEVKLDVEGGGSPVILWVDLSKMTQKIPVKLAQKPLKVTLDPNINLLFEGKLEN
jgi:aminopeptidase N